MTLIADSGSTKTAWKWGNHTIETPGINPVRDSDGQIRLVLSELESHLECFRKLSKTFEDSPIFHELHFYGAGCIPPYCDMLARQLRERFPEAIVHVESDMLGAARALCGHEEGIACILGTGSNSCLYDGERIVQNVSPLGYILGDEGSGAVLGRLLVGEALKGDGTDGLKASFLARFSLTQADIIERVYRQSQPNRFLASLVPFLAEHRTDERIHTLLVSEFRRFFRRNVAHYRRPDLPVNFVGGVAHQFQTELAEAATLEGHKTGVILRSPIDKMASFHAPKG